MDILEYISSGKLKCVCYDFDDTIVGWTEVRNRKASVFDENCLEKKNWYVSHRDCYEPIDFMKKFLKIMHPRTERMFCISWIDWSGPYWMKKEIVEEILGNDLCDDLLAAGTREMKVEILKKLCKCYGYKPENILLVDDHPDTCVDAREAGFCTISPIGVYAYLSREKLL